MRWISSFMTSAVGLRCQGGRAAHSLQGPRQGNIEWYSPASHTGGTLLQISFLIISNLFLFGPIKTRKKRVKKVEIFWNICFRRFYTHMHPFKLLFDFFEQNFSFFPYLSHFGPFGPPKKGEWTIFGSEDKWILLLATIGHSKTLVRKWSYSGSGGPTFRLDYQACA